jgi:hypothetical protein
MSATVPDRSTTDPVSPGVQRLVALSGVFFVVLTIVTFLLSGDETPDEGAALEKWTQYAKDNEDNMRIASLVFGLAAYNFLLFIGFLRSVIGEAERGVRGFVRGGYMILAGGIAGIVGMGIGIGLGAGAFAVPETPPETLRALSEMSSGAWLMASAGFGACFVTVGLVNQAVRALPSWLGWVSLGAGICFVLQLGVLLSEEEDNAFGAFFPLGFLLLAIFVVGASVTFFRGLSAPAATPRSAT